MGRLLELTARRLLLWRGRHPVTRRRGGAQARAAAARGGGGFRRGGRGEGGFCKPETDGFIERDGGGDGVGPGGGPQAAPERLRGAHNAGRRVMAMASGKNI